MAKIHYILDNRLIPLLDGCEHYMREGVLYLGVDTENDMYMVNISYDSDNGLTDCDVFRGDKKYTLTDLQEEKIRVKAMHLHQDYTDDTEDIQDHKEDLDYHNFKEDQFS